MKALDTNVLLRYFIVDDPQQAAATARLIKRCTADDPAFINIIVLCELAWTLKIKYDYDKPLIAKTLEKILETEQLHVENAEAVRLALDLYRSHTVDFADALIGVINRQAGYSKTATFDKKAAKLATFELLS